MVMKNDINKTNDTIQTQSIGRPKKDLDEDVIAKLSQIGCTQEEIGAVVEYLLEPYKDDMPI